MHSLALLRTVPARRVGVVDPKVDAAGGIALLFLAVGVKRRGRSWSGISWFFTGGAGGLAPSSSTVHELYLR